MIDPRAFRNVLGAYPTGVCLITAQPEAGERIGMVVGSFTSISLDPPLVGFFADKGSRTWQALAPVGSFCVNVLGTDQLDLCRRFAARGDDKFAGVDHAASPSGHPHFPEAVAWIDCVLERTEDIGDHVLVVGRVVGMDRRDDTAPLLFCSGNFHSTSPIAVAKAA